MATIVVHKLTGQHYVLVGTGYSFFKDSRPSFLGGVLFPHRKKSAHPAGFGQWSKLSRVD